MQLLIAVYMEALFQSCQCLCRHTCSPWSTQPVAALRKQAHSGRAVFHYSWPGTGTVLVLHPPSPCPVWSQALLWLQVVGGAHGYGVQTAAESPREVPAAPAALPQHTE